MTSTRDLLLLQPGELPGSAEGGMPPSVGAVSYTLGGGLGILAGEFGYAADHVRSLDLVTTRSGRRPCRTG